MSYVGGIYTPTNDIQAQQLNQSGDYPLPGGGTLFTADLATLQDVFNRISSHPSNYDSNRSQFSPSYSQIASQLAVLQANASRDAVMTSPQPTNQTPVTPTDVASILSNNATGITGGVLVVAGLIALYFLSK